MDLAAMHARDLQTCGACEHCVANYDRWYYLFGTVVETLRKEFKEREIKTAYQVLKSTLESVGVTRRVMMGLKSTDVFALHPSREIVTELEIRLMHLPNITVKRGRPVRTTDQIIDIEVFKQVHKYVERVKDDNQHDGWVGLAEVIRYKWPTLLDKIAAFPGNIRRGVPPIGAVRDWMEGFDEEIATKKKRLMVTCLAYRLFTFLRYEPKVVPRGEGIGEYVLRNEKAMRQRYNRAVRALEG